MRFKDHQLSDHTDNTFLIDAIAVSMNQKNVIIDSAKWAKMISYDENVAYCI